MTAGEDDGAAAENEKDIALRWAAGDGDLERVKSLLAEGANIHARSDAALLLAAVAGQEHVVRFLLENGAKVQAWNKATLQILEKNGHGKTAKLIARRLDEEDCPPDYNSRRRR